MPYIRHRRPECNTGRPHPSVRRERPSLAADERIAGPGRHLGRAPVEGHGRRTLRGWTRRRGIPGPSGPCHGYRSFRRVERRDRCVRTVARARSARPICFASSSTCRRPASSSPRLGGPSSAGRSSPSGRRSGPAATSARSISWSSTPATTSSGSPKRSSRRCSDRPATRAAPSWRPSLPDDPATLARWERRASPRPARASNEP